MRDRRSADEAQDFIAADSVLDSDYMENSIMKQAANVFTPNIFRMIQIEYRKLFSLTIDKRSPFIEDGPMFYDIYEINNGQKIPYLVVVDPVDTHMICNCQLFVNLGLLCCHCFAVRYLQSFYGQSVYLKIPESNILKRWTRKVKKDIDCTSVNDHGPSSDNLRKMCASFWLIAASACKDSKRFESFVQDYKEFYNRNKPGSYDSDEVVPETQSDIMASYSVKPMANKGKGRSKKPPQPIFRAAREKKAKEIQRKEKYVGKGKEKVKEKPGKGKENAKEKPDDVKQKGKISEIIVNDNPCTPGSHYSKL